MEALDGACVGVSKKESFPSQTSLLSLLPEEGRSGKREIGKPASWPVRSPSEPTLTSGHKDPRTSEAFLLGVSRGAPLLHCIIPGGEREERALRSLEGLRCRGRLEERRKHGEEFFH